MSLQQHFAKYISGENEQIEALCALYTKHFLPKKEFFLQKKDEDFQIYQQLLN